MTEEVQNYSTETPAEAETVVERPVVSVPGAAVGRRKQAIARVRLIPGEGSFTVNGRALEEYFPNKLHQQLITDPFTLLGLTGSYDVIARINGGGPSGQAGALRLAIARSLNRDRPREQPCVAQEGWLPDARRSRDRAQEGRSQEGPQGLAVLEALIERSMPLFGTDGVRGLANGTLTADLALSLAQATAVVLGQGRSAEARRAEGRRGEGGHCTRPAHLG